MNWGFSILLTSRDLDGVVAEFATLVGLVLALITLFTSHRDSEVQRLVELPRGAVTVARLRREAWLNGTLAVVTSLLFASGLPLYVRTAAHFSVSSDHSVRWEFLIVWPLLVPLAAWQARIARRAYASSTGR